jgi:phospholipase C
MGKGAARRRIGPGAVVAGVFTVCAILFASGTAHASLLFSDGFESGGLSRWTSSSGFAVQQQVVFEGLRAGRATTTGSPVYASKALSSTRTNLYADAWVNLVSAAAGFEFLKFMTSAGAGIVGVGIKKWGSLVLWNNTLKTTRTSTTAKIGKNAWHEVQLHASIGGASSQVEVWLDGSKVDDLSGTSSLGSNPIARVLIGTNVTTTSFDVAFDDVIVDRSFIGSIPVDTTPPSVPKGLVVTNTFPYAVDLGWNASSDDFSVRGYTVYRDGSKVGTSQATSFSDRTASPSATYSYAVDAFDRTGNHSSRSSAVSVTTPEESPPSSTIQHIVIIDMENHTFDDTFGRFCAQIAADPSPVRDQCDGATEGKLSTGEVVPLTDEPDIVPDVDHTILGQQTAIDGGKMDGFDKIGGCKASVNYACYAQFDPSDIPNLTALATTYAISDRTFEFATTPSWGGHLVLASASLGGFDGGNPKVSKLSPTVGPGWGCDSNRDAKWWNGSQWVLEPSCIPDQAGNGPYRSSPVPYVPTIFDRLEAEGLTWKIYGASDTALGYGWTICPSFWECLGTAQRNDLVDVGRVVSDAQAGSLPNLSIVAPTDVNSQHNDYSMAQGDNWIGQVVTALESGPDWPSTAVFITYDDCGCFYDHVPPPAPGIGIRVPMVIVSPYARAGYTDSTVTTFMGMLAYTENTFGLPPLASADASAYDFSDSFDYSQVPPVAPTMMHTRISAKERAWVMSHPADENDPT